MEFVVVVLAVIGALCVLCTVLLGVWIVIAGTRDGVLPDEDQTLDVQNHRGDSRPVVR